MSDSSEIPNLRIPLLALLGFLGCRSVLPRISPVWYHQTTQPRWVGGLVALRCGPHRICASHDIHIVQACRGSAALGIRSKSCYFLPPVGLCRCRTYNPSAP